MVLLLALALVFGAHTGAAVRPHVAVTDDAPFTVRGWGFHAGEQVKVVVVARNHVARKVTAGAAGGFRLRMQGVELGSCSRYGVRATGDKGSRASFKVVSECANLGPAGP